MSPRRIVVLLAAVAVAVASFVALSVGAERPASTSGQSSGDLYVLEAGSGELRGNELVLHGVAPRVTSFTDRPQRSVGSLSAAGFVSRSGAIFGSDPPNAALVVDGAPASRDVAVLELRHPRYEARTRTLTYSVHRLKRTDDPALAEFDRRADRNAVARFGRASLFVDSGGVEEVLAVIEFEDPPNETLSLKFDSRINLGTGVSLISGINTPATNTITDATSTGEIEVRGSTLRVQTTSGGGLRSQVVALLTPNDGKIEGEATIPPGGSAALQLPNSGGADLPNGKFSIAE